MQRVSILGVWGRPQDPALAFTNGLGFIFLSFCDGANELTRLFGRLVRWWIGGSGGGGREIEWGGVGWRKRNISHINHRIQGPSFFFPENRKLVLL